MPITKIIWSGGRGSVVHIVAGELMWEDISVVNSTKICTDG